ncbi:MAG: TetR/AcrR family transcriptional regulator [Bacteroidetes bacterium]|nr:TetR/AcrR family transcriptional regulator [Bacteroidota bacterium]
MSPRGRIALDRIHEKSRSKILSASVDLFSVYGYENTSMSQVALHAGVSKGLIYNYYESKEKLIEAIVFLACDKAEDLITEVMEYENPYDGLEYYLESFFRNLQEDRTFWKLINFILLQSEMSAAILERLSIRMSDLLEKLESMLERMGITNPYLEARLLQSQLDGIALHYLMNFEEYNVEPFRIYLLNKYNPPIKYKFDV